MTASSLRFLLDSNCWMEIARARPQTQVVQTLLTTVPATNIFITDFGLCSIGLAMRRHKVLDAFPMFIKQMRIGTDIQVVRLNAGGAVKSNRRVQDSQPGLR